MSTFIRHRPMTPLPMLRREVDRLFNQFFPALMEEGDAEALQAVWAPRMDLSETDAEFLVRMDLPGIPKEHITINVEDDELTVSGERREETKEEKESFVRVERSYGSFYRCIPLPKSTKADEVEAEFKDGVLKIHIPKTEKSKMHRVPIS